MNIILALIALPLIAALGCLFSRRFPRLLRVWFLCVPAIELCGAVLLFMQGDHLYSWGGNPLFQADALARLTAVGIAFFGVIIACYTTGYYSRAALTAGFCANVLMTIGAGMAACLADNMLLLCAAWGFMGITLYLLIGMGDDASSWVAKKTMIIVGGADVFMIFGVVIVCAIEGGSDTLFSCGMSGLTIPLSGTASFVAYCCLAAAAFAKAGVMPFHGWIPDCAEHAPLPVTAFLPAALDKLVGIYLLARISLDLFRLNAAMQHMLLLVGAVTVVGAVLAAMMQHDLKKLLGYHMVSQVGYMVLGIGTGTPVGIVGGLFHMVNNSLYKSALFLIGGEVKRRAGSTDLDRLGGLARVMPVSFACGLVASCAISGIPPLNGFASKWMVYRGMIEYGKGGGWLWVIWLLAAMFGSALTLASFVKLLHAVFLGRPSAAVQKRLEQTGGGSAWMRWPVIILAAFCVVFGVWAVPVMKLLFTGIVQGDMKSVSGVWDPTLATLLIGVGLLAGLVILLVGRVISIRESETFIGGEGAGSDMALSGVDFYATISEMPGISWFYRKAAVDMVDIYERGREAVLRISGILRTAHSGLLPLYLVWCLVGVVGIMLTILIL